VCIITTYCAKKRGSKDLTDMQDYERHTQAEEGNIEAVLSAEECSRDAPQTATENTFEAHRSKQLASSTRANASSCAASQDRHWVVPPSKWCITLDQLGDLWQKVEQRYPDIDPTVYEVVADIIKPMTQEAGCSYALMLNPNGVDVDNFVTHAWGEGFKAFVRELCQANISGGLWVCFVANPQTWEPSELGALLGKNPYMSPFYIALTEATRVVVVRNSNVNMYTRLWCVFELWSAGEKNKLVKVVGPNPRSINPEETGYNATCSNKCDTIMLRQAIAARGAKERVNMYVGSVIFAAPDDA